MTPEDPRHGTEAGAEQHVRDGENPRHACQSCHNAKLLASRRRNKRKKMGSVYTRPLGERLHLHLLNLRDHGATYDQIGQWSGGLSGSLVWRIIKDGPEGWVYARTWLALNATTPKPILTPIGATRRIRALHRLGYSFRKIADEVGTHVDTITDASKAPRVFMPGRVLNDISSAYDRLAMVLPVPVDRYDQAGISRSRNSAEHQGWPSPLAWDDIDDPNEQPSGTNYRAKKWPHEALAAEWDHLRSAGTSIDEAAQRLGVTVDAIQTAVRRRERSAA